MPFLRHGVELHPGSKRVPSWMYSSLIFHWSFWCWVRELGISVGGSVKFSDATKSGLVRYWHVVFVYFFIQERRVVGISAARWAYSSSAMFCLLWSLYADMIRVAMLSLSSFGLFLILVMVFSFIIFDRFSNWCI